MSAHVEEPAESSFRAHSDYETQPNSIERMGATSPSFETGGFTGFPEVDPYAVPLAHLLVERGWNVLRHELAEHNHRIVIDRSRKEGAENLRLTIREFLIAWCIGHGLASKQAAFDLSLTTAAVRGVLARACQKLKVRSPTRLPLFWYLMKQPDARIEQARGADLIVFECVAAPIINRVFLTVAERAIVQCIIAGETNLEISRCRGTSARTVANQIAVLLRKFGSTSRGELAARALGLFPRRACIDVLQQAYRSK